MSLENTSWNIDINKEKSEVTTEVTSGLSDLAEKKWFWILQKLILFLFWVIAIWWVFMLSNEMSSWASNIMIDNPTWTGITVNIDGWNTIEIPAYESTIVDITSWEHTLYTWEIELAKFEKKSEDSQMFLNPTGEVYIEEYVLYLEDEEDISYDDKIPHNEIEAYWNTAEWPFVKYDWVVVDWSWDYSPWEPFPTEVTLWKSESYRLEQKLYRFEEFVDMYNIVYIGE